GGSFGGTQRGFGGLGGIYRREEFLTDFIPDAGDESFLLLRLGGFLLCTLSGLKCGRKVGVHNHLLAVNSNFAACGRGRSSRSLGRRGGLDRGSNSRRRFCSLTSKLSCCRVSRLLRGGGSGGGHGRRGRRGVASLAHGLEFFPLGG